MAKKRSPRKLRRFKSTKTGKILRNDELVSSYNRIMRTAVDVRQSNIDMKRYVMAVKEELTDLRETLLEEVKRMRGIDEVVPHEETAKLLNDVVDVLDKILDPLESVEAPKQEKASSSFLQI